MNKEEEQQNYSSFSVQTQMGGAVSIMVGIIWLSSLLTSFLGLSAARAGMHHGLLCHTFGFVGFQIHGFTFYFAFNLIKAWKACMAARKYQ
uniref:Uncharacterized protein n=1 Tax=Glossina palpalis gambiensis TaxID=67801 RepID=A0A1B0AMD9_9MUSC